MREPLAKPKTGEHVAGAIKRIGATGKLQRHGDVLQTPSWSASGGKAWNTNPICAPRKAASASSLSPA
jgi:hypothetical protein